MTCYPGVPKQRTYENYRQLFVDLLHNFQEIGVKMFQKNHFVHSHLN